MVRTVAPTKPSSHSASGRPSKQPAPEAKAATTPARAIFFAVLAAGGGVALVWLVLNYL